MKKLLIAFSIFLTIGIILINLCLNKLVRVNEVGTFKFAVNERIFEVQQKYIRSKDFNRDTLFYYDKLAKSIRDVEFDDMVNSFKSLTIQNWYTPEQCRFLEKYNKFE